MTGEVSTITTGTAIRSRRMIDLHTHILPGVDDGASDLETALAMARLGQERGLVAIAATPHFEHLSDWDAIKLRVEELGRQVAAERIDIEIIAGAELFIDSAIMEMDLGQIPTYGDRGKYCLIEFPMFQIPLYAEQVLFSLQTKGIVPIIAHPERYGAVMQNPNLVLKWLRAGCLIQINSGSILGRFGAKIQETAKIMLTHNMVQFVASDAHGLARRGLNLSEAFDPLVRIVGLPLARALVADNPAAMLTGTFALSEQPYPYRKKRRFFFF